MKIFYFILSSCFFIACASSNKSSSMNSESKNFPGISFDKQGHRGCRGLMPENTIAAMLKALDLGVTTLEMDICFSKDKKALLSHEPFFNHEITTKPDGSFIDEKEEQNYNLFQMNYDSIKKYDVGLKPHPRFPGQQKLQSVKPLLTDLFEAVKGYMKKHNRPFPYFNIETKSMPPGDNLFHPEPVEFVELLMKVIKENKMENFVIIQSFDYRTLQYLHKHFPSIKTAMLIEEPDKTSFSQQLDELGFLPTIYSPENSLVTIALVENCHKKKIKIIPWTVNDKKELERLIALGVDGIISDYPNLFNAQ
jgi:glycerophosphoryl diester phosphodiesterase